MDNDEDLEYDLNDSWVENILEENKEYEHFYNEVNNTISIYKIYVNKNNSIISIKKDNHFIDNGVLTKFDLSLILKNSVKYNNIKFSPISLLKYNIDLDPINVQNYISDTEQFNFLSIENSIKDLKWNDSINLFQDMNCLYLIFYEKQQKKNETKSIFFKKYKKNKTRKKKLKTI